MKGVSLEVLQRYRWRYHVNWRHEFAIRHWSVVLWSFRMPCMCTFCNLLFLPWTSWSNFYLHWQIRNKSTLGHVIPPGRPRWIYRSDVERRFFEFETKSKWKKIMLTANLVIPAQICGELSCGKRKVSVWESRRIDGQKQAMTIPIWHEGPRVKYMFSKFLVAVPSIFLSSVLTTSS